MARERSLSRARSSVPSANAPWLGRPAPTRALSCGGRASLGEAGTCSPRMWNVERRLRACPDGPAFRKDRSPWATVQPRLSWGRIRRTAIHVPGRTVGCRLPERRRPHSEARRRGLFCRRGGQVSRLRSPEARACTSELESSASPSPARRAWRSGPGADSVGVGACCFGIAAHESVARAPRYNVADLAAPCAEHLSPTATDLSPSEAGTPNRPVLPLSA